MVLPVPNPAPNQHMIAPFNTQGLHPINKARGGPPKSFTANAPGSTTTILGPDADNTDIFVGDKVRIYTSANVLKHNSVHTITVKSPAAGTTTYTFTPAAAGATASGDYIAVSLDISEFHSNWSNYLDIAAIDARLIALGATQAFCNTLTLNDKIHRLIKADDAEMTN